MGERWNGREGEGESGRSGGNFLEFVKIFRYEPIQLLYFDFI
jgi:hypothetical protein